MTDQHAAAINVDDAAAQHAVDEARAHIYDLAAAEPRRPRREHHIPPALPEPPPLCRLGLHRLRPISVTGLRPAGSTQLGTVTSTCRRRHCALLRHEQHRTPPGVVAQLLLATRAALHTARTRLAGR